MGNQQRTILLGLAALVAVAAIGISTLGSDDDSGSKTTAATTTTQTATTATTDTTATQTTTTETTATETTPAEPAVETIEVKGGKAVGGIQKLKFDKDSTVTFRVKSDDTTGEIHFHGYDIKQDVAPGKTVTFKADGSIPGVFEVEVEDTGTQIAEVTVS